MSWVVPAGLRHKGERNYAHGTDIFLAALSAATQQLGPVLTVDASFHRMLYTDPDLEVFPERIDTTSHDTDAVLCGTTHLGPFSILAKASQRPLGPSYAYDESLVAAASRLSEGNISLIRQQPFSSIETLVAMTKLLHQKQVGAEQKWVWSRLQLSEPLPELLAGASVRLDRVLGTRLTKSSLVSEGKRLGCIFFSTAGTS